MSFKPDGKGFDFTGVIERLKQQKSELPKIIANDTVKFFEDSWKKKGWDDNGITKWKEPRRRLKGKGAARTRAILVQTGQLRKDFVVARQTFNKIVIINTKDYAAVHNEGLTIYKQSRRVVLNFRVGNSGKSRFAKLKNANFQQDAVIPEHDIKMPQRQFMGQSRTLDRQVLEKIDNVIKDIWR